MDTGLRGRTAIVTGGSSGIGRAITEGLMREEVSVAVIDRQPPLFEGDVHYVAANLGGEKASAQAVQRALGLLGTIDLAVCSTAVALHEKAEHISDDALSATLSANFKAAIWTCREAIANMIPRRHGAILFIGSTAIFTPIAGQGVYRASKAALKAYMETTAIEVATAGIRVNMLTPGTFATPLTSSLSEREREALIREIPLNRIGRTADLVASALLLLSDNLSPYTTCIELIVDGGISLRPMSLPVD